MIFWIILAIGVILGLWMGFMGCIEAERPVLIFWGIIWGALAGFVVAIIICVIVASSINDHTVVPVRQSADLVALQDQQHKESSFSGAFVFVLGVTSGGSHTDLTYNWYQR